MLGAPCVIFNLEINRTITEIIVEINAGTHVKYLHLFSAANLALAGFPQTNALGESMPSRH